MITLDRFEPYKCSECKISPKIKPDYGPIEPGNIRMIPYNSCDKCLFDSRPPIESDIPVWININDRLPSAYQTVVAFGRYKPYSLYRQCIMCWYKHYSFQLNEDREDIDVLDVTHWMPLQ